MEKYHPRIRPIKYITIEDTISKSNHVAGDDRNQFYSVTPDELSAPPWPLQGAREISVDEISNISPYSHSSTSEPSLFRTWNYERFDATSNNVPLPSNKIAKTTSSMDSNSGVIGSSIPALTFTSKNLDRCNLSTEHLKKSIFSHESIAETSISTSTIPSSVSQPSSLGADRIIGLKSKITSMALYFHKNTKLKISVGELKNNVSSDDSLFSSKFSFPRFSLNYKAIYIIQSILGVLAKVVSINIMLCVVYLHFMFYKYSLSIAIHGLASAGGLVTSSQDGQFF